MLFSYILGFGLVCLGSAFKPYAKGKEEEGMLLAIQFGGVGIMVIATVLYHLLSPQQ